MLLACFAGEENARRTPPMDHVARRGSYFGIDAILLDEERVDVEALHTSFLLARHLPGTARTSKRRQRSDTTDAPAVASDDLERAAVVNVPLWAARTLHAVGAGAVQSPRLFSAGELLHFKRDPFIPNMKQRSPYMLQLGAAASPYLPAAEGMRVAAAAQQLFLQRYAAVVRAAFNKGHDAAGARDEVSVMEVQILQAVQRDAADRKRWHDAHDRR
jgi:hypothetical protein